VEAVRQAELTLRMALKPVSQTPRSWPGTGQRVQPARSRLCSPSHGNSRSRTQPSVPAAAISTTDWLRASFRACPRDRLGCVVRYRRIGWAGRHRLRAVQHERVPLRVGERGCCLGQFPDPGIQAAAGVACGVPAVVVTFVALGRGVGTRPTCRPGSGFPLRRCSPSTHESKASHWRSAGKSWCGNIGLSKPD
jgi:hypothetical protein